jgi:hypothetical protein
VKASDYVIVRASKARQYAPAMLDAMVDHVEASIAKELLDPNARIKLAWVIEDEVKE